MLRASDYPHYRSFSKKNINYPHFSLDKILPIISLILLIYATYMFQNYGLDIFYILDNLKSEILFGLLIILFGYFLRFIRWRIFLRVQKLHPPISVDIITWMASYAFTVTPGKAGEGLRSILLKERCNLPITKTFAAIVMERISDLISLLVFLVLNFSILFSFNKKLKKNLLIFFTFILGIYILKKFNFFKEINNKFISLLPQKITDSINTSWVSFSKFLNFKTLTITAALGTLSWFCEGISFWILLKGFGFKEISLGFASIAHTAAGLLGAISFIPGGLGATE